MAEEEGYKEARRLVKEKYGQGYRIASAYIERLTKGPAIKAEDSASLRKFSISLTSCTNTLKEIGYLSKLENPDSMKKIIDKLPYGLRLKWRDTVDSIAERGRRDITIADITKLVVDRARAASHPIFGQVANHESKNSNSSYQERPKLITSTPRRTTFATQGSQQTLSSTPKPPVKCLLCQHEHWLSQCQTFRSNTISERSKFVRGKNLCGNCLVPRHFIKDCPKKNFCKVSGCTRKHSTFLHPVDGKTVFVKSDTTNNQPSERKPGMPAGNTAIKDCNNGYVEAGNALQRKSSKIALAIVDELCKLLEEGGFRLTKWLSNSATVLASIPEEERAPSTKALDIEMPYIERALGVQWNVSSDTFGFTITIKDRPATRRGILSIVSSIYDPLGFVAPFTLPAKILLQDLCHQSLGWDDIIPEPDVQRWQCWLQDLPRLEGLAIDRCFKPKDFSKIAPSQLHHFSDASQQGYGAASYMRLVNQDGKIHCSFVTGKSRLAPLKPITVPRMELSAAVLSTRLDQMILKELSMPLTDESTFWTDSTCVLSYIENEDKRFHTFMANRIPSHRQVRTTS